MRALAAAAAAALALGPARSRADDLRIDPAVDLGVTGGLGVAWIATELLKPYLAPDGCRWCDPPSLDRAVRSALVWDDTGAADAASWVIAFALLPSLSFGLDAAEARDAGGGSLFWDDALLITESAVVAAALDQAVKFAVGRRRPFVHALDDEWRSLTANPADNDLSFYSGHTTLAFSLAVSTATIATIRDYDSAPYLWVTGLLLASATGLLRIGADRHYFLDVLVGAATGALAGWAIPALHRVGDDD